jgi:hypothetical protein
MSAVSILVAAAANNVAKGAYSCVFAARAAGWMTMAALVAFGILGMLPAIWP